MNPPTATPRTDAALYPMNGVEIVWPDFARTLETELAEAKAEAAHYMSVAQKATDDLTRLRADNVAAHQMACAAGLERDQLRAELKELSQAYELNRVSIDELDADRARASSTQAGFELACGEICVDLCGCAIEAKRCSGAVANGGSAGLVRYPQIVVGFPAQGHAGRRAKGQRHRPSGCQRCAAKGQRNRRA